MRSAPKPSVIKEAEGNRAKLAKSKIVYDPSGKGEFICPKNFSYEEKTLFEHTLTVLPDGVSAGSDQKTLELFVVNAVRFDEANRVIKQQGMTSRRRNGNEYAHPMLAISNTAGMAMLRAANDLGLTPVGRAKMASTEQKTKFEPMNEFLASNHDPAADWAEVPGGVN